MLYVFQMTYICYQMECVISIISVPRGWGRTAEHIILSYSSFCIYIYVYTPSSSCHHYHPPSHILMSHASLCIYLYVFTTLLSISPSPPALTLFDVSIYYMSRFVYMFICIYVYIYIYIHIFVPCHHHYPHHHTLIWYNKVTCMPLLTCLCIYSSPLPITITTRLPLSYNFVICIPLYTFLCIYILCIRRNPLHTTIITRITTRTPTLSIVISFHGQYFGWMENFLFPSPTGLHDFHVSSKDWGWATHSHFLVSSMTGALCLDPNDLRSRLHHSWDRERLLENLASHNLCLLTGTSTHGHSFWQAVVSQLERLSLPRKTTRELRRDVIQFIKKNAGAKVFWLK